MKLIIKYSEFKGGFTSRGNASKACGILLVEGYGFELNNEREEVTIECPHESKVTGIIGRLLHEKLL